MKNNEINYFGLTGLSNSRLSVTSVTQNEKISVVFDRITVVGYLIEGRERQLKNYVERDPRINLRDTGFDKFKAHALDNKVRSEERRVGKEGKRRGGRDEGRKKEGTEEKESMRV